MHNIGQIDSIANVIFIAGQKGMPPQTSSFLYHGIVMNFNAGGVSRTILKENLSRLDGMEERMADTISKKNTKLTVTELKDFFSARRRQRRNLYAVDKKKLSMKLKFPLFLMVLFI